jgi:hypothetical protein
MVLRENRWPSPSHADRLIEAAGAPVIPVLAIARLDKELAVVRAQVEPLKWLNGIVIAGVLALISKIFFA